MRNNSLLLVVDLQNEFINDNTKKATREIAKLVNSGKFTDVVFTRFINSPNNPTFTRLGWKGCMDENSRKICIDTGKHKVFDKTTYSAYGEDLTRYIHQNNLDKIYICGIDADCCVLVTAMNLFENNYDVYVLEDHIYSSSGEKAKQNAVDILKRNIGEDRVQPFLMAWRGYRELARYARYSPSASGPTGPSP
ncbi:cysteine hydrolase [Candidatus Saccharibacteria bacterium]|nr:cysteine hydrolase [Candidatus Saccharibacteria bacterium]